MTQRALRLWCWLLTCAQLGLSVGLIVAGVVQFVDIGGNPDVFTSEVWSAVAWVGVGGYFFAVSAKDRITPWLLAVLRDAYKENR